MPRQDCYRMTLLLVWIAVSGCSPTVSGTSGPAAAPVRSPSSRPLSLISPIEFFPPEQKRISQHLNWRTGCFKIESTGQRGKIGCRLELWKHGTQAERSSYVSVGDSTSELPELGELSIAVSDEQTQFRVSHAMHLGGTGFSGPRYYDKPGLDRSTNSVAKIPGTLELQRGQEVVAWAFLIHKSSGEFESSRNPDQQIIEQVKSSEWALVLKVALDPVSSPSPK